jgi:hypothetical protein
VAHIKCRKSNTEINTNICCWEKIRRFLEILAFAKNQADLRNPCAYEKSGGFEKSLLLLKFKRNLRNPCFYKKSGGFIKSLRLQKHRRTIESLQALKSPRQGKTSGTGKAGGPLTFRLGGISSC